MKINSVFTFALLFFVVSVAVATSSAPIWSANAALYKAGTSETI